MMANMTSYTDEYRLECADYVISSGKSAASAAEELGINRKTLQRWVKARRDELEGKRPTKAESAELRAAQKRIRELGTENEFLKKQRPSSPRSSESSEVSPDEGGEGQLSDQPHGKGHGGVQVRALLLDGQGRAGRPVGGAEGGGRARVAGIRPHVRGALRACVPSGGVHRHDSLPRAQVHGGAGDSRHRAQLQEEDDRPRRGRPGQADYDIKRANVANPELIDMLDSFFSEAIGR